MHDVMIVVLFVAMLLSPCVVGYVVLPGEIAEGD